MPRDILEEIGEDYPGAEPADDFTAVLESATVVDPGEEYDAGALGTGVATPDPDPATPTETTTPAAPAVEIPEQLAPYYNAETGKWFGRYDDMESAIANLEQLREFDSQRGREAFQRGTQTAAQTPQPATQAQDGFDPLTEIDKLTRKPPATLLLEMPDTLRNYLKADPAIGGCGLTDEQIDSFGEADILWAQMRLKDTKATVEASMAQQEAAAAAAEQAEAAAMEAQVKDFTANYPDLEPWQDLLLDRAADAVVATGRPYATKAEFDAAVAEQMRAEIARRTGTVSTNPPMPAAQPHPSVATAAPARPPQHPQALAGTAPPAAGGAQPSAPVIDTAYYFQDGQ